MPVDPTTVTSLQSGEVVTVVPIITAMAKAYTRGRGFTDGDPNAEIATVIATASARFAGNGLQLRRKKVDDVEYEYQAFNGWTLTERIVLDRYRVKAM